MMKNDHSEPLVDHSISDLAIEFDVTPRTLRFYEEKGLLKPRRRGQTRIYSAADRVTLKLILRGKRLGFSLDESHDIIRQYDPSSGNVVQLECLLDKIRQQRERLLQQREDIELMLADLQDTEDRCLHALATDTEHQHS